MATTQNTLFGRSSGQIGNVITTTWKGLNIIKSKPMYVKRQFTPAEILNQNKIKIVSKAVSKIGQYCKYIFNLGTTGTTAFAEMQKFFRNRITYELLIDSSLFTNAKIGSSNCSISNFNANIIEYNNFNVNLAALQGNSDIINSNTLISLLMVKDDLSKIVFLKELVTLSVDNFSFSPNDYGFEQSEQILFAIKATREIPGQLFTSELTFSSELDFISLE